MLGQLAERWRHSRKRRSRPNRGLRWSWYQGRGSRLPDAGQAMRPSTICRARLLRRPIRTSCGLSSFGLRAGWPRQEASEALDQYMKLWPSRRSTIRTHVAPAAFNSKMERGLKGLRLAGLTSDDVDRANQYENETRVFPVGPERYVRHAQNASNRAWKPERRLSPANVTRAELINGPFPAGAGKPCSVNCFGLTQALSE